MRATTRLLVLSASGYFAAGEEVNVARIGDRIANPCVFGAAGAHDTTQTMGAMLLGGLPLMLKMQRPWMETLGCVLG